MTSDTSTNWTAAEARHAISTAPIVSLDSLCPPGSVAVIAPHPDDETLGCGGLIARCISAGRTVVIAILTTGAASHPNSQTHPPKRLVELRWTEACLASARLGAPRPIFFCEPDGALTSEAVVPRLEAVCRARDIHTLVAPWAADPHPDHKAAHNAARIVAEGVGARLLCYPIWGLTLASSDDAGPALECSRLDIADVLDRKRFAMDAYQSQLTDLIRDDPSGFKLSQSDLGRHLGSYEPFLSCDRLLVRSYTSPSLE